MLPAQVQNALLLLIIIILPNHPIALTAPTPLLLSTRQHALHDSSITYEDEHTVAGAV
jgi:hypothetical protein